MNDDERIAAQIQQSRDYIRARYGNGPIPDDTHWYDKGGVVPPGLTRKVLHPDECVVTRHPMQCVRPDHPTATSDCATTKETA